MKTMTNEEKTLLQLVAENRQKDETIKALFLLVAKWQSSVSSMKMWTLNGARNNSSMVEAIAEQRIGGIVNWRPEDLGVAQ